MKNRTINKLLYLTICTLSILIVFMIFKIVTRPHYISSEETGSVSIAEADTETDTDSVAATSPEDYTTEADTTSTTLQHGKTSSRVNIRELPITDSRVLATVEKDYTFDILDILDSGWTEIVYEDSVAYISSDFVILVQD